MNIREHETTAQHIEKVATAGRDWLAKHLNVARLDWIKKDLGNSPDHNGPEECASNLMDQAKSAQTTAFSWQAYMLSYLACRFDLNTQAEVRVETVGRDVKFSVSVKDTWIGTLTVFDEGGEENCLARNTYRIGSCAEVNGDLAGEWLCFDPAHRNRGKS